MMSEGDEGGVAAMRRNNETDAAKIIATAQAKSLLKCLAVAGFAAMNVMLLSVSVWAGNVSDMTQETRDLFHWLSALIALPAAAYAGQPFFQSAFRALRARHVNMDVPISIGVTLALGLSPIRSRRSAPTPRKAASRPRAGVG
jgi:Cu2+-exporting ATPase